MAKQNPQGSTITPIGANNVGLSVAKEVQTSVTQAVATISQEVRDLDGSSDAQAHAFIVGLEAKLHSVREHISKFNHLVSDEARAVIEHLKTIL